MFIYFCEEEKNKECFFFGLYIGLKNIKKLKKIKGPLKFAGELVTILVNFFSEEYNYKSKCIFLLFQ